MDRRDFIKKSLLTLALGGAAPSLLSKSALAAQSKDKILVVVNLFGGNDQLNTLVPFKNDLYYRLRPNIAIKRESVLDLGQNGQNLGLHPELRPLMSMWDQGNLALIPQVGYPNPNRSHFISTSIWHTADPTRKEETGWLGRWGDLQDDPFCDTFIGGASPQAVTGHKRTAPAVSSVDSFTLRMPKPFEEALEKEIAQPRLGPAEGVRQAMLSLRGALDKIGRIRAYSNKAQYPDNPFGKAMADVARMIAGGLGSSVYYTTLGGWDTHAAQPPRQQELLSYLAQTLSAFRQDMKALGRDQDVMIMVFSEFGRQVAENASFGTDHGQGGLMLVMGGGVRGGLYGSEPDLEDLELNALKYKTDFRNVYAASLRWIQADIQKVLGANFQPLGLI
ncbi:protein of unknown function DUF1501 [Allomeiothermus silvanus DSM 9946]|uniref:Twin-arginine translocation pathway signal n=1 Tax=Allomeiothermus silvanus (strain ATCC 700542 / DSM 9946 / NBRC 106475 / NCIMB 13440 / VI-R2) TaxID=526227 RepID=D7BAV2_ALLS1|nr:DUF1501 domain-containing protein [Allomeiothermus silvanus]ADH64326.1 protein of unknown function DUF1501 [Allomeiothermus silvanus DSM 9946]